MELTRNPFIKNALKSRYPQLAVFIVMLAGYIFAILAGLIGINEAGYLQNSRCKDPLDLLESKTLPGGGFAAETKYFVTNLKAASGVSPINWGPPNPKIQNDYVTVRALGVLKRAGRF